MSLFILVRMQSQLRVWIIQSPYSSCLNWPVLPDCLFVLGDYSSPLICSEDLNCLLRSTCMKRNTGGFFNSFLKVIHLKSLPESMDPFTLKLWSKSRAYLEAWAWSVCHRAWRWWRSSGSQHCGGLASDSQFWSSRRYSGHILPRPGIGICTPLKVR